MLDEADRVAIRGVRPGWASAENGRGAVPGDNGSAPSDFLLSGAWADTSTLGQGFVFDINPLQNLLFAGWYTYAANAGATSGPPGQHWFTVQTGSFTPSTTSLAAIAIYETTGGVFNASTPATTVQVGTASIAFASCTSATLTYQFTAGENAGASGTLALSRLTPAPAGCTP